MPNRLAAATSPYLLQHADNPVDWFPWGDEAFDRARAEDKPVFLSIGYASCHWCHVMAHEVFEDHEVADVLNEHFVSIKVDREERPDVDETYMAALQVAGIRGGWPMSLFLTPDRRPFFGATYIPKEDRGEYPGFLTIARHVAKGWREQRPEFERAAERFAEAVGAFLTQEAPQGESALGWETVTDGLQAVLSTADLDNGGFGDKPKFPPHTAIELLFDYATRKRVPGDRELQSAALGVALLTLEAMELGGIHDHVGGGFHRYSVDESWFLPHFEKMLYDNALLLAAYSRAADMMEGQVPEAAKEFRRTADRTARWMLREMRAPNGLFYSAIDADSEGEEGWFYVWSLKEVQDALGPSTLAVGAAFGLEANGNYEDEATGRTTGKNILALSEPIASQFDEQLDRLLEVRNRRPRPMTDTKCLVGWNGLAIRGLARAGFMAEAAAAANRLLLEFERTGGLPRLIFEDHPQGVGFLEDYAFLAWGLEALHEATGDPKWRQQAERVYRSMTERFWDDRNGGFFATEGRHEVLFGRMKPVFDQPIPSANSVAARLALELGDEERAERTLRAFQGWMERGPQSCEGLLDALLLWLAGRSASPRSSSEPEASSARPAPIGEVRVELEPHEVKADADGKGRATLRIHVPEGLHLNGPNPPALWLTPTALAADGCAVEPAWPESVGDRLEGGVAVPLVLSAPSLPAEFELRLTYQPCTETECLRPAEKRVTGVLLP
ncbi:MAG: thioredoxin domain-containing protein [Armatimonadetes bacterium]|nr:thioredoxin domain-containing protein [Armatimonadota bacterium]